MENKAVIFRPRSSLLLVVLAAVGGTCALGSVFTAVWWFRPDPILKFTAPVRIQGDSFAPGDWLRYEMDYCKTQDIEAEVHYAWIDGVAYAMPGMTLHRLYPGCHTSVVAVQVPRIPPGTYKLEIDRIYHSSPLRDVEVRTVSAPFMVGERKE
jgi:hypothetical protein